MDQLENHTNPPNYRFSPMIGAILIAVVAAQFFVCHLFWTKALPLTETTRWWSIGITSLLGVTILYQVLFPQLIPKLPIKEKEKGWILWLLAIAMASYFLIGHELIMASEKQHYNQMLSEAASFIIIGEFTLLIIGLQLWRRT